jgi:hypothetical protein
VAKGTVKVQESKKEIPPFRIKGWGSRALPNEKGKMSKTTEFLGSTRIFWAT